MPVDRYIAALQEAIQLPQSLEATEACRLAASRMGLVHALQDFHVFSRAPFELLSPRQLGRLTTPAREFADTQNDIFFYVGPPMLDYERPGALVFRAAAEGDGVVATPWDSGGLHRRRAQALPADQRKALLRDRTMPASDYRRALTVTLLLRWAGKPADYLQGKLPDPTNDPDGVYDGTHPSFTYEARFPSRLGIQTPELAFVAVRRDAISEGVHQLRAWCSERRVPFEVIDGNRTVRDAVLTFGMSLLP